MSSTFILTRIPPPHFIRNAYLNEWITKINPANFVDFEVVNLRKISSAKQFLTLK